MRIRVAASSANLGSGFDCVGVALGIYDELEATPTDREVVVEVSGEGAGQVPLDERHLVVRSMRYAFDQWALPQRGVQLRARNAIPHSRGLGSSAAAIVAGLTIAWGIAFPDQDLDRRELLRLSNELEGHPDNAGAAVYGGAILAWPTDDGADIVPFDVHPDLRFRVFVPDFETPTAHARQVLPDAVPRLDAVVQASRSALLLHALTSQPEHLLVATEDRLHQHYRSGLMAPSYDLLVRLRAAGVPTVISGAGPTVLACGTPDQLAASVAADGFRVVDVELAEGVTLTHA